MLCYIMFIFFLGNGENESNDGFMFTFVLLSDINVRYNWLNNETKRSHDLTDLPLPNIRLVAPSYQVKHCGIIVQRVARSVNTPEEFLSKNLTQEKQFTWQTIWHFFLIGGLQRHFPNILFFLVFSQSGDLVDRPLTTYVCLCSMFLCNLEICLIFTNCFHNLKYFDFDLNFVL